MISTQNEKKGIANPSSTRNSVCFYSHLAVPASIYISNPFSIHPFHKIPVNNSDLRKREIWIPSGNQS